MEKIERFIIGAIILSLFMAIVTLNIKVKSLENRTEFVMKSTLSNISILKSHDDILEDIVYLLKRHL